MGYEIVKVKAAKSRFGKDVQRRNRLYFFNLTSVGIDAVLSNPDHPRPFTDASLTGGSVVRDPRHMSAMTITFQTK